MSKPPINPDKTAAGIAVDPRTLERVIPESKRPDGSVRKQIKIRPGFTPQEDVRRFRGTKQAQMDATSLPKGHIIGWSPPSSAQSKPGAATTAAPNKNAKKRQQQKARRAANADKVAVKDDWEDEDDEDDKGEEKGKDAKIDKAETGGSNKGASTSDTPNWATAPNPKASQSTEATQSSEKTSDALAEELEKLNVR